MRLRFVFLTGLVLISLVHASGCMRYADMPAAQWSLPMFEWPPPESSSKLKIEDALLRSSDSQALGDIDLLLSLALTKAGYGERSYFSVPGGFAVVTRLEQVDANGFPKVGRERWATDVGALREFSLSAYLKALFGAPAGHFRVIALIVTDRPVAATGPTPDKETAIGWLREGADRLPELPASLPYSRQHACTALIYEFETVGAPTPAIVRTPGRLGADDHLRNGGFLPKLEALGKL